MWPRKEQSDEGPATLSAMSITSRPHTPASGEGWRGEHAQPAHWTDSSSPSIGSTSEGHSSHRPPATPKATEPPWVSNDPTSASSRETRETGAGSGANMLNNAADLKISGGQFINAPNVLVISGSDTMEIMRLRELLQPALNPPSAPDQNGNMNPIPTFETPPFENGRQEDSEGPSLTAAMDNLYHRCPDFKEHCTSIYYRTMAMEELGSPLWRPAPSKRLTVPQQKAGTCIGDVGILTKLGSFESLFNVYHPPGDEFPPMEALAEYDVLASVATVSYITSRSVDKCEIRGSAFVFESKRRYGAILTVPNGLQDEEVDDRVEKAFMTYMAAHATSFYKYARKVLGREIKNGDLRLITGRHYTKSWGMAAFDNPKAPNSKVILTCKPISWDAEWARHNFGWDFESDQAYVRHKTGPDTLELQALASEDPSQERIIHSNQVVFVRTLNLTLGSEDWVKVSSELSLKLSADSPSGTEPTVSSKGGLSNSKSSSSGPESSTWTGGSGGRTRSAHLAPNADDQDSDQSNMPLDIHPSNRINERLLEMRPNAKRVITADEAWMSVLRKDDLILPSPDVLFDRIIEVYDVAVDQGVLTIKPKIIQTAAILPWRLNSGSMDTLPWHFRDAVARHSMYSMDAWQDWVAGTPQNSHDGRFVVTNVVRPAGFPQPLIPARGRNGKQKSN